MGRTGVVSFTWISGSGWRFPCARLSTAGRILGHGGRAHEPRTSPASSARRDGRPAHPGHHRDRPPIGNYVLRCRTAQLLLVRHSALMSHSGQPRKTRNSGGYATLVIRPSSPARPTGALTFVQSPRNLYLAYVQLSLEKLNRSNEFTLDFFAKTGRKFGQVLHHRIPSYRRCVIGVGSIQRGTNIRHVFLKLHRTSSAR